MDDNDRAIVSFTGLAHALVHTYELSIPILVVVWLTEFSVSTALLGTVVADGIAISLSYRLSTSSTAPLVALHLAFAAVVGFALNNIFGFF